MGLSFGLPYRACGVVGLVMQAMEPTDQPSAYWARMRAASAGRIGFTSLSQRFANSEVAAQVDEDLPNPEKESRFHRTSKCAFGAPAGTFPPLPN